MKIELTEEEIFEVRIACGMLRDNQAEMISYYKRRECFSDAENCAKTAKILSRVLVKLARIVSSYPANSPWYPFPK